MPRTGRPRSVVLPMDEIRELAAQGLCLRQLAERYKCSRQCMLDRMREADIPRLPAWSQPGDRNPAWKGGRQIDDDGYVLIWIPSHPFATTSGCVREHRLVMELKIGRYLTRKEVVHHIDGDKANNAPDNLELFSANADHLRETLRGKVPKWTEDGRRRILLGIRQSIKTRRESSRKRQENDAPSSQRSIGRKRKNTDRDDGTR